MENIIFTNQETKKACVGRLVLSEVASLKMKFFSFINNCSFIPQILRGNTKASQKLLLHTSTRSIVFSTPKVKSYPQGTKKTLYSSYVLVKWLKPFYQDIVTMSTKTLSQKACQLMIYWKVLNISQGQLYHENVIKI